MQAQIIFNGKTYNNITTSQERLASGVYDHE